MARPRGYDVNTVLENAMQVFWRRGYVAASMAEIYRATGLRPGNLYATFEDKEELFRQAFGAYAERFRASLPVGLDGRAAIVAWLEAQARLATEDPERKGCLIINTITERDAHSAKTRALADARLEEIQAFFRTNLRIAADRGDLPGPVDVPTVADALVGAVVAIMSLARGGAAEETIWNIAKQAIASLATVRSSSSEIERGMHGR